MDNRIKGTYKTALSNFNRSEIITNFESYIVVKLVDNPDKIKNFSNLSSEEKFYLVWEYEESQNINGKNHFHSLALDEELEYIKEQ